MSFFQKLLWFITKPFAELKLEAMSKKGECGKIVFFKSVADYTKTDYDFLFSTKPVTFYKCKRLIIKYRQLPINIVTKLIMNEIYRIRYLTIKYQYLNNEQLRLAFKEQSPIFRHAIIKYHNVPTEILQEVLEDIDDQEYLSTYSYSTDEFDLVTTIQRILRKRKNYNKT